MGQLFPIIWMIVRDTQKGPNQRKKCDYRNRCQCDTIPAGGTRRGIRASSVSLERQEHRTLKPPC